MEELARGNRVSDYRTLTPSELWDKYQKNREKSSGKQCFHKSHR